MSVVLRLKRTGAKNDSCFRIVAMDKRSARDGKTIEELGFYDPRHKNEKCNLERAEYWLSVGAQPSETIKAIIKRSKEGIRLADKEKPRTPSKKALEKLKAEKEAKEEAKAAKTEPAETVKTEETAAAATE
ncbi:MAG: 30S ribosomal protein S16 [Victivallales bacterium]|nr:30S ribosomal protein S16 [Victivallales bacterium]